jgi:predicted peptidase
MQQSKSFNHQIIKSLQLNYLLYLPSEYGQDIARRWPLILFLHGVGERGNSVADLLRVKAHGLPRYVNEGHDLPFIVVSPQCPTDKWWTLEEDALITLLNNVITNYAVDASRLYLTGMSMGGYGTWSLAIAYPDLFAAIAPVSGGGIAPLARRLKNVPAWVFHGASDDIVPVSQSQDMVDVLKDAGGNVQFSVFPNLKHDLWTVTYNNPKLYQWFLTHQRRT